MLAFNVYYANPTTRFSFGATSCELREIESAVSQLLAVQQRLVHARWLSVRSLLYGAANAAARERAAPDGYSAAYGCSALNGHGYATPDGYGCRCGRTVAGRYAAVRAHVAGRPATYGLAAAISRRSAPAKSDGETTALLNAAANVEAPSSLSLMQVRKAQGSLRHVRV